MFKVGDKVRINPEHLDYFTDKHYKQPQKFLMPSLNITYVIVNITPSGFSDESKNLYHLALRPESSVVLPTCYARRLLRAPGRVNNADALVTPRRFVTKGAPRC